MIPVAEARARILAGVVPLPAEQVALTEALGRVLAEDVAARLTHPPLAVSAMDGWAVRTADIQALPVELRRIGSAPAGQPFPGTLGPGDAVRIFTGGALPDGADTVVVQEDCDDLGESVRVKDGSGPGRWVRPAGQDFAAGVVGFKAGRRLGVRDLSLAAAMNVPWLKVRRRPRVAILATGDEIVMPGDTLAPGQIVSSNALAIAALVKTLGGEPLDLGIARDEATALSQALDGARGADLLVTCGGASVGEHDLVRKVLGDRGLDLGFWKIAMRPGKPLMFGRLDGMPVLGLPGNPVSSLVCALLFLRPLLLALLGLQAEPRFIRAVAGTDLPANDGREDYLRATLAPGPDGMPVATPFPKQDSGMLSRLAWADGLVLRARHAPAAPAGTVVEVLPLDDV
ncbi:molybdopterin molybdotransferase MoeA [Aerophototrophica crusticola]|uniref:Molybdopterin molybdenumtransferase n=1 Tax=Aerophototrophica crusticola TaxID=1709002 RepID=A0A858R6W4_9PROT|nr:molybdopterin molybdotransferase MoeA [Rhodospirillaceae bacterium B3]